MTSDKRSPLTISVAAVLMLLALMLDALSLVGHLFGPSDWQWLGMPAFFLSLPTLFWYPFAMGAGARLSEHWPWLRPCRYVVGGIAAVCIVATVASSVGLVVTMFGGGRINSGAGPIVYYQGPYALNSQPVSRARWLAAAVCFQVAWHGFVASWILGLLYVALSKPAAPTTGSG